MYLHCNQERKCDLEGEKYFVAHCTVQYVSFKSVTLLAVKNVYYFDSLLTNRWGIDCSTVLDRLSDESLEIGLDAFSGRLAFSKKQWATVRFEMTDNRTDMVGEMKLF